MDVRNETLSLTRAPQLRPQLVLPRSTKRYSALAVQEPAIATSSPAPTVHPVLLPSMPGKPGVEADIKPRPLVERRVDRRSRDRFVAAREVGGRGRLRQSSQREDAGGRQKQASHDPYSYN